MRALVTGSAGFLGRHFATALQSQGWDVSLSDPRHPHAPDAVDCRVWFGSHGPDPVRFDLVVHCAALVDGRETIEGKQALVGAYNLQLDGALFEWALRTRPGRIVYISSSAAYPAALQHGRRALREDDMGFPVGPDQTYGWVKLTGEILAGHLREAGVPTTVVRPFSGYGPDQDDCYPFPAIIARASRRESPLVVWGDGQQVRDLIHVDDVVAATLTLAAACVAGPVNLGTGVPTSMDDLAYLAMTCAGYDAPILHLDDKPQGVKYRVADTTLLSRYHIPRISVQQGVEEALFARQA